MQLQEGNGRVTREDYRMGTDKETKEGLHSDL